MPITIIDISTNIWADVITSLNDGSARWNNLGEYDNIDIDGGSIDGTIIGATTPAEGTFTNITISSTLDLTGTTILLDDNSISGNKVSGGTIECDYVTLSFTPTDDSHAVRKSYVDTELQSLQDEIIAFSIALG